MEIVLIILVILVIIVIVKSNNKPKSADTWQEDPARKAAAKNAAAQMTSHQVNRVENEAVQIRRVIVERKLNVNAQVLTAAIATSSRLIDHAERIRREVEQHRNQPAYLQQLYRLGVGISNENHDLRMQLKPVKKQLYALSRSDSSLRPLFEQVKRLDNIVYNNELELNNRNRVLRLYIGNNFSRKEWIWNDNIEKRAQAKRSS